MLTNRSAPHARIVPVLTVRDVRAAVAWYGEALGLTEHVRIGEGHQLMLKVEDAAAVLARATERGALETAPLRDWEYGERQAAFTDPFGHEWVLTQTRADTAPEQWGGQTITSR
jgi:uncharacterized glyoxalase superfamily protein PhnB